MRSLACFVLALSALIWSTDAAIGHEDAAGALIAKAREALSKGQPKEALALATKAIEVDAKNPQLFEFRAQVHASMQHHTEAVADFSKCIALDPRAAEVYDHRGSEHFKLGQIAESIADFDKFIELKPEAEPGHWRRGISYYYAGRFDEGRKQFQGYEKVDTNDVENAVWCFICTARLTDVEKARSSMLKIGHDRRVPLMQIYDLFRGKLQPQDVLTAAQNGRPAAAELRQRLFYAHLYLGLYYEVQGDKKRTLDHMTRAVDQHMDGHYMGDVARVHLDLLRKQLKKPAG